MQSPTIPGKRLRLSTLIFHSITLPRSCLHADDRVGHVNVSSYAPPVLGWIRRHLASLLRRVCTPRHWTLRSTRPFGRGHFIEPPQAPIGLGRKGHVAPDRSFYRLANNAFDARIFEGPSTSFRARTAHFSRIGTGALIRAVRSASTIILAPSRALRVDRPWRGDWGLR
jgi:hypothetical protein